MIILSSLNDDCLDRLKMDKVRFERIFDSKSKKGVEYGPAQSDRGEKKHQGF